MISAKVIKDSISESGKRLTTLQLCFPRCILSEFNTHRQFSRNAASSRAIPVKKMIRDVIDNPFIPLHWGKNQPGMQAFEETNSPVLFKLYEQAVDGYYFLENYPVTREKAWLKARDNAVEIAQAFADAGYHKQLVNRLLEPFMWTHVLVTSTEWDNFFRLRNHPDAEPHIKILAQKMREALDNSKPTLLKVGEWHLPFISDDDKESSDKHYTIEQLICVSVARSARLSYYTFDGKVSTFEADLGLYQKLANADPEHGSPFEHQATPDILNDQKSFDDNKITWKNPSLHGNFVGWKQNRKITFNHEVYK